MLALLIATAAQTISLDYSRPELWLCRPGRADVCYGDLSTTQVRPDGRTLVLPSVRPARAPKADCFYVYPTVSLDPTPNSDTNPGVQEKGMTESQLAWFRRVCRTFAPVYRQVTLTALRASFGGKPIQADFELAYDDVRSAWRRYLASDNGGRPFVLIGHSQGSLLLKRLIAEEIDGKPVQRRLISAILPGAAVLVPEGKDVGGDFRAIALCRSAGQTRCAISWASYRDGAPPPANALFGKSLKPGYQAGCTNPAALGGGRAALSPVIGSPWWVGGVAQYRRPEHWTALGRPIATRFVATPGLLTGECVRRGGLSYLAVSVGDGRAHDLIEQTFGPATIGDAAYPDWGFHVVDMEVVRGDLLRTVARQIAAWRAR